MGGKIFLLKLINKIKKAMEIKPLEKDTDFSDLHYKECQGCNGFGYEGLFNECDECGGIGSVRKTFDEYVDSLPPSKE